LSGLTCADFGDGPSCHKVCNPPNGTECAGLTGMSTDYICTPVATMAGTPGLHGVCTGQELCTPAEKAAAKTAPATKAAADDSDVDADADEAPAKKAAAKKAPATKAAAEAASDEAEADDEITEEKA